jgi:ribosome recycling factor
MLRVDILDIIRKSQCSIFCIEFSRISRKNSVNSCHSMLEFLNANKVSYSSKLEVAMIKDILKEAEVRMHAAIQNLEDDLAGIRTGRASPALVEKLPIDYYDMPTPLMQLASISVPEPRSLLIKPFDPTTLKTIERTILASDLGLTPNNDGKQIRLNLPPLTEERRRELVKVVHNRLEECRVAIRNVRRDLHNDMRDFEKEKLISEDDLKRGEEDLQKITDKYIEEVNEAGKKKEQEIMEV